MEERKVADVVCPICGMPVEVAQQFIRPSDNEEYTTIRCMSDHYITLRTQDVDMLIVGADAIGVEVLDDVDEQGLD